MRAAELLRSSTKHMLDSDTPFRLVSQGVLKAQRDLLAELGIHFQPPLKHNPVKNNAHYE